MKEVSYVNQGCIFFYKNTVKTVILLNNDCFLMYYILKMEFILVMANLNF